VLIVLVSVSTLLSPKSTSTALPPSSIITLELLRSPWMMGCSGRWCSASMPVATCTRAAPGSAAGQMWGHVCMQHRPGQPGCAAWQSVVQPDVCFAGLPSTCTSLCAAASAGNSMLCTGLVGCTGQTGRKAVCRWSAAMPCGQQECSTLQCTAVAVAASGPGGPPPWSSWPGAA
jgi:hypothetical protein